MQFSSKIFILSCAALLSLGSQGYANVKVTRDDFGVPTIHGGDFAQVSRAIGKVHAEDRLWQIFLLNIVANGRASKYLGPDLLESDIFQRKINPTDKEIDQELEELVTENTKIAFRNYVKGLNDYVAKVNKNPSLLPFELFAIGFLPPEHPIPEFTLNDILRAVRAFAQSFSPTQIPMFQLNNLVALGTFAAEFGSTAGYAIFEDVDPTTSQVRSRYSLLPSTNFSPPSSASLDSLTRAKKLNKNPLSFKEVKVGEIDPNLVEAARTIGQRLKRVKDSHKRFIPSLGSNGQAIGPSRSQSGNPLLRGAPQPNFNHPSDFYQVKVINEEFTANFFTAPGVPFGPIGTYNTFGLTVQTGHLPTNDFLFEPITNVISTREEVIKVRGLPEPVVIEVQRSSSGGWVIENPLPTDPTMMLTLRCAFIERQLQGFNFIGELPFIKSVPEFFTKAMKFSNVSDLLGFEGQCADCEGNIGAFQLTAWTELPAVFDRRLPQGNPIPAPPNSLYDYRVSARKPMEDINTKQGFYTGWNNTYKQFAAGSADTLYGLPLSRAYWLLDYLKSFKKISFHDLKQLTVHQAVANSIVAFNDTTPNQFADLFTPLFKKLFFKVIRSQPSPTPDQLEALALLEDYEGKWFEGDEAHIIATDNVSDKFILASAWLLNVAANILNPFLEGTQFEVAPGSLGDPLPTENAFGDINSLGTYQGNLLARILGTSSDNTLIFPAWLEAVDVNQVIIDSLNQALTHLGGFGARPWGAGLRPIYVFKNAILGPVAEMKNFNASGLYYMAEFTPHGVRHIETVIPLGENGTVFVDPITHNPVFAPHNFDQQPLFETFRLIKN